MWDGVVLTPPERAYDEGEMFSDAIDDVNGSGASFDARNDNEVLLVDSVDEDDIADTLAADGGI